MHAPSPLSANTSRLAHAWWDLVQRWVRFMLAVQDDPKALDPLMSEINGVQGDLSFAAFDGGAVRGTDLLSIIVQLATHDPASVAALTLVGGERLRQILKEGYSVQHDHDHDPAEFANAAAAYALCAATPGALRAPPACWPWEPAVFKPKSQDLDLVRSGALTVAGLALAIRFNEAAGPDELPGGEPQHADA